MIYELGICVHGQMSATRLRSDGSSVKWNMIPNRYMFSVLLRWTFSALSLIFFQTRSVFCITYNFFSLMWLKTKAILFITL
jgi:hypothetical protein